MLLLLLAYCKIIDIILVANHSSNTADLNSSVSYLNVNNATSNANSNNGSQLVSVVKINNSNPLSSPLGEKYIMG